MNDFDPNGPGAPRIEHAIVDEQMQLQQYLADIAMADLELLPPESERRVRPGGLLAQYRTYAAEQHAIEDRDDAARVREVGEVVEEVPSTGIDRVVREIEDILRAPATPEK